MSTPVIIAARNEEAAIGASLEVLARQAEHIEPIVVVNGSSDSTADIARNAGALVLESEEGKMRAIQQGLHYLGKRALAPLLILDADSQPRSERWSQRMTSELQALPTEKPAIVWGPYIFKDDIPQTLGAFFTAASMRVSWADRHDDDPRTIRGGNTGLKLRDGDTLEAVLDLDNYWPREDVAIYDTVMEHDGRTKVVFHPDGWVDTSGTRIMQTIKNIPQNLGWPTKATDSSYEAEAPAGTRPYNSPHTRHKNKNPELEHK